MTMTMDKLQERMKKQFGTGATTEKVGEILVVHLDKPDVKERARRLKEAEQGGPKDDDCVLCKALAKSPPSVVVYDADAVLCFGQDGKGPYASGFPRKAKKKEPVKA